MSIWKDPKVVLPEISQLDKYGDLIPNIAIISNISSQYTDKNKEIISPVRFKDGCFITDCDDIYYNRYYYIKDVAKWCYEEDLIKQAENNAE